ncbi:MAG: Cadherin [uncultured bacterium]|nr:MAG: Cadherin [uncultured bacterium]
MAFRGELNVACGDVDGDGKDEIGIARASGKSTVRIFDFDGGKAKKKYEWNAFGKSHVGASIAFGDIDKDGKAEIIAGQGKGGASLVRTFEASGSPKSLKFTAFEAAYTGGIDVDSADFDGDGKDDVVVSKLSGSSDVKTYKDSGTVLGSWRAFGKAKVGANVKASDINNDGKAEVIVASATGAPQVRSFSASGTPLGMNFFAYNKNLKSGLDLTVSTNPENL